MKSFYFGGQKSGKSSCASKKALMLASSKPYYIATYDNSYEDKAMQDRVNRHIKQRAEEFITIEEPKDLTKVIKEKQTYLIDCMTMYILNNLENGYEFMEKQLEKLFKIDCNIIFILNDINNGVIPIDKYSREFVDISGLIGQFLAKNCDEVIEVKYSLERRLK
ncbi:bifunctional adenosylcobinamide kinase/adenosylcobinamide-phosphate guanylyltransferase [Malaciobacter marinus]|jgi:adenosylcobinamide kinase/adenosylcobinamide-phosphate guanylyltransferase|uniref:Adenosylcobinamide kinase n=1 Tax=Malaciobacter marinus TaxID=505249 RepID=A0A1T5BWK7_9BACT|nr:MULTISPECIES: bifunctional adenosylcobinamide kinase/adenosylcobinamide-phosphate guanylyltransferase [Malaciobacter]AXX88307.1 adenosylcobinamide kinase / adenosylcobinamide-phosphate guanylyltransferase [Malaciobacter marinus]PHO11760.1 cobinamide phosphate guanylyltransferase [Malaciobacter marinus]PHO14610.1 cobinamide phosphate guanylyltransferase [Malaciobacter marinus]PPK60553.1 adenosylcobinamide kinase /adenosylcobinamide-phosphate guanylyltransferase [Malaciobacter marinus]RYA2327